MSAKFLDWFISPQGRKVMSVVGVVVSGSVCMANFLPHTQFITNYRDFVALRKNGERVQVPKHLSALFNETLTDVGLSDYHRVLTQPFIVFGFDAFHMGSLNFVNGSYVGLPVNYTYTDLKSIKKEDIFINDEPVNWARDDAKQLLESLILSDDAKKYAMAREVLMTNNYLILFKSVLSGGLMAVSFGVASQFNEGSKLFEKPRAIRFGMYALNGLFWWGIWCMQKDLFSRYYESSVDEQLAQLGENYIKGAVEYWEKMQKRNKAMRTLLGPEGLRLYKMDGDEISFFRHKHLPISSQKEFFEKKLEEKRSQKQKPSPSVDEKVAEKAATEEKSLL